MGSTLGGGLLQGLSRGWSDAALTLDALGAALEAIGPVLALVAEKRVVVAVLLPPQGLPHDFRVVRASDEPVPALLEIVEVTDDLAVLRLAEALPLLAVSDVLDHLVVLDEEELLVPQLDVEKVAGAVVDERSEPRHFVQVALRKACVGFDAEI